MKKKPRAADMKALNHKQAEILHRVTQFDHALTDLRYEGKPRLGKNLKRLQETSDSLGQETQKYFKLEEKVLFPFFKRHIPKLEPVICLLELERKGLKDYLRNFQRTLKKASRKNTPAVKSRLMERLRERGVYMAYFLKNHILAESSVVFKKVCADLRPDEIAQLREQIKRADHDEKKRHHSDY